jgi:hypothetical protein
MAQSERRIEGHLTGGKSGYTISSVFDVALSRRFLKARVDGHRAKASEIGVNA